MSILKSLNTVARPEKTSDNPVLKKREKLLAKLDQQLAMAKAHVAGEIYTAVRERWQTNKETGLQEKVQIPKRVSPWFYKRNNQYLFEVRYANKPLEISKDCHAIAIESEDKLVETISMVIDAVANGELDEQLASVTIPMASKGKK